MFNHRSLLGQNYKSIILELTTSSENDHSILSNAIAKLVLVGAGSIIPLWKDNIGNSIEQTFFGVDYTGVVGDKKVFCYFDVANNQKYELTLGPQGSGSPNAKIKGDVEINIDLADYLQLSFNNEIFSYNFNKANTQSINELIILRNNNASSVIDISLLDFSGIFDCDGFALSELSIGSLILPASNSNSFTSFKLNSTRNTTLDLSGFIGAFSGDFTLQYNTVLENLSLPPDLSGISNLYILQNGPITTVQTVSINNPTGNFTRVEIYRNGSNGVTWDLSSANFSGHFQCYEFGSIGPGRDVLIPASNSNNFTRFELSQLVDKTSVNMGSYSGTFTGYFRLAKMSSLTSITYPSGTMTGLTTFIVQENVQYNSDINLGTSIIADTINISRNNLSTANLNSIINRIYSNKASFSANNKSFDCRRISGSTQQAPSGTYDGTTDWSGGMPTSPLAKLYDLRNNVTGTYNWTFVAFYNGTSDETH